MREIFSFFLDFIFPPSAEELRLRALSPRQFLEQAPKAQSSKAIFAYRDPLVKKLIWQIKYKKNKGALEIAGLALFERLIDLGFENSLLIPVPLSKKRRRERGFNQCELLIEEILKFDQNQKFQKDFDLLFRTRHIEKQTLKNREERLKNIGGIFSATKKDGIGKIIIIDDVITTGSTLEEARKTLNETGYSDIEILAVAH